jgi:hypothetical protein
MAADRLHAGRGYAWRGARRIILRSGDIAVRTTPAAGRCWGVCALVTSYGIGGTGGLGGAVPFGDGRGRVVAGLGSGWGAAGSGMVSSLGTRMVRRSVLGDRWVSCRPGRCDGGWAGERPLADAQQCRRQLPAAAVQGGRSRAGPAAGTG